MWRWGELRLLGCVCEAVEYEMQNVLVGKEINNVLAFAAPIHDVVRPQDSQSLGDHSNRFTLSLRELWTHAEP